MVLSPLTWVITISGQGLGFVLYMYRLWGIWLDLSSVVKRVVGHVVAGAKLRPRCHGGLNSRVATGESPSSMVHSASFGFAPLVVWYMDSTSP